MPLELYERQGRWWFKGRIDEIPDAGYERRSLGAPRSFDRAQAERRLAAYVALRIKRHHAGTESTLTFAEAVLLYTPTADDAKALKRIVPEIGDNICADISPAEVRGLGPKLYPENATSSWMRWVVTPVRAVINNAHDDGLCPPIRIKPYTRTETMRQDRKRGRVSGERKRPGSWQWLDRFNTEAPPRLVAMALLMFTTGARISQAVMINDTTDVDLQNARLRLPSAKGHPATWVTLTPETVAAIANMGRPRHGRLFGYKHRWSVYKPWHRACDRAGIEHIMPHAAGRHGFGTEMVVRAGIDPATAAQLGRWSDIALMLKTYSHADGGEAVRQQVMDRSLKQHSRTNPVQSPRSGTRKAR